MATPAMLVQSLSATVIAQGKQTIRVLTKNPDGTPLDVSSGYTIAAIQGTISQDNNLDGPGIAAVTSAFSGAFDTTGVTLTVDGAALSALMPTLHATLKLGLTNDGGSTASIAAIISVTLNNFGGLI